MSEYPAIGASADRFEFQLGDIGVSVSSERKDLLADLRAVYRGYPPCTCPARRVIRMEVRRAERSFPWRRRFVIFGDGEVIGDERRANELFPFLEWGINWQVIAKRSEYLQIHAATLARWGQGVVLAGSPGSGKSTLAAGLLAKGWRYLSDEFALIDPTTLNAQPFPKAICIKFGSFDLVKRLGLPFARRRDYVKGIKGRVGYLNPLDVSPDAVSGPCPVRFVIFVKYTGTKRSRLESIPRSRAAVELLRNAFNRRMFHDEGVSIAASIVRGAQCYLLQTGDIEEASARLDSLVSTSMNAARHGGTAKTQRAVESRGGPRGNRGRLQSRRSFLGRAAKIAYTAPVIVTLMPQSALAQASGPSSCYPAGHACPGEELCCGDLQCKSSVCALPCQDAGELCFVDSDCCSGDCDLGVCD